MADNYNQVVLKGNIEGTLHFGIQGPPGPQGSDGGYYVPAVEQTGENELEVSFSPSLPDMPAVDSVRVELPHSGGNVNQNAVLFTEQNLTPEQKKQARDNVGVLQPDWNQNDPTKPDYVKNRTHYEEGNQTVIEWDGNTEGRDNSIEGAEEGIGAYLISENTPSAEELVGATLTVYSGGAAQTVEVPEDQIVPMDGCVFVYESAIIVYEANTTFEQYNFAKPGVYFIGYGSEFYVQSLTYGSSTIVPIDEKFIPDTIARKSDITTGGGAAIIDVIKLPTENIREDCFYRLLSGSLVINQYVQNMYTIHCVETLPETGLPATNIDQTEGNVYYNLADGEAYGYLDDILSMGFGVPAGWYPVAEILGALGYRYAGVITNILNDPNDNQFRLILENVIYDYKNSNWTSHKKIGWAGTGVNAEIFNNPTNVSSGECAHSEGGGTIASGYFSHSEGGGTIASGECAHSEGSCTMANGDFAHSEGNRTVARGRSQHVQGEHNLIDPEYNPDTPFSRSKYAHIVGNGTSDDNRSNAHTLDWEGNAWYQGDVYVYGTGQDDEAAKKLATEEYVNEHTSTGALPPVTAENNGAFLRVVDGAWAVATIPSAEGVKF